MCIRDSYLSVLDRVERNDFQTLPYPLSKSLRAHGIPLILSNISKDIHFAAQRFEPEYAGIAAENMWRCLLYTSLGSSFSVVFLCVPLSSDVSL